MAEETGVKIDSGELLAALDCTICYTSYKEPMMAKCGHTYCRACIEQCIGRNHECPDCKTPLTLTDLTRNIQIERLQRQVQELQDHAKKDPSADLVDGDKFLKSPIVSIFQTNLKECLTKFERYCEEIKKELEECKKRIRSKYAMQLLKESRIHVDPVRFAELKTEETKEVAAAEEQCNHTLTSLIQSYDRYMRNVVPEPKIESIKVVVRAPAKNVRIENVTLRPFDTFHDTRLLVEKHLETQHDSVLKWGADVHYVVIPAAGPRKAEGPEVVGIQEEMKTIGKSQVTNGSEIQIVGSMICISDCAKPCITLQFNKDAKKAYNYFTCETCSINWVCEPCIQQCHKGHVIKEYLKAHVPSWACCYCLKKKCIIPNKGNPAQSMILS